MRSTLQSINWKFELGAQNIDEVYDRFCSIYNSLCEQFITKRPANTRKKKKSPWMTPELTLLSNKKRRLFFENLRTRWKSSSKIRAYRRIVKELSSKTRVAIMSFERSLAFDKNPKRLFSYAASRNSDIDTSIATIKAPSGVTLTAPHDIADCLNSHFASVFQIESEYSHEAISQLNSTTELSNVLFLESDIESKIAKLDRTKSIGVDGIHPHVLSECAAEFALPLSIIFSKSFNQSSLPSKWRKANVTPIFKNGSRTDPSNYRPISLTSVPCKIMEDIVRDAMMLHLRVNNLLAPQQHGFVPRKACNTNLIETVDTVTALMAEKKPIDIVFIDFSKAFDRVPHKRLNHKLKCLGIVGRLVNWIESKPS